MHQLINKALEIGLLATFSQHRLLDYWQTIIDAILTIWQKSILIMKLNRILHEIW